MNIFLSRFAVRLANLDKKNFIMFYIIIIFSRLCLFLQLSQVDITLSTTPKGLDRDNLLSLKSDIEELIFLTKESLQSLEGDVKHTKKNDNPDNKMENLLDREYALFKVCFRNDY